jgi:hypothetical protein
MKRQPRPLGFSGRITDRKSIPMPVCPLCGCLATTVLMGSELGWKWRCLPCRFYVLAHKNWTKRYPWQSFVWVEWPRRPLLPPMKNAGNLHPPTAPGIHRAGTSERKTP